MGINLDIPTLSVVCVLLAFTYSISLALIQKLQPQIKGINLISLALFTLGVGFLLLSYGNNATLWLTKVLANSFIMFSFTLILHGVCQLRGYPTSIANHGYYALPLVIIGLTYFTYFSISTHARIAIVAIYTSYMSILTFYANHKGVAEDIAPSKVLLSSGMLIYAGYALFRMIYLPFEHTIEDFMVASWVHQYAFISLVIMIIFIGLSVTWMLAGRLVATIYDTSLKDELTKLYNRRALEELVPKEVTRAFRFEHQLSILLIDIDNFKQINDIYGHQTGDQVLREIGRILKVETFNNEFSFRYGGEEFLVLLPETTEQQAEVIAERIREVIARTPLLPSHRERCTASFGVSALRDGEHWESLIERADKALYSAKRSGKNRVVVSD